jgi:4-amino-4-deoxy-L-arabinose transferase-like glycosyltransferase
LKTSPALVVSTLLVACLLYLVPLGLDAPLTDPDEGLHAVIAQEMVERGDLVVPRVAGMPFLDKPIVFFWMQAASLKVFGMSTAAARLPGALAALLGILTTGWLARLWMTDRAAWVAAGCYATAVIPFALAQAPVHDMAVVPLTNVAIGWLWRAVRSEARPVAVRSYVLASIALGLSILTKGLVGMAIVGLAIGVMVLVTGRVMWRVAAAGLLVVVGALLVAAPWYLAMNTRVPGYLHYYFVERHLLGFATDTQRHGGQRWWYYLPIATAGAAPWVLYIRPGGDGLSRESRSLLWAWLMGAVVLLSLAGSKAVTYILPAMPAVALLAAAAWTSHADAGQGWRRLLHVWLFVAVAVVVPWVAPDFTGQSVSTTGVVLSVLTGALGCWLAWSGVRTRTAETAWWQLLLLTSGVYLVATVSAGAGVAASHASVDVATYLNAAPELPAAVYVTDTRLSFLFYVTPDRRRQLAGGRLHDVTFDELRGMTVFPAGAVVAVPADLADRLDGVPALEGARRERVGRYLLIVPPFQAPDG